MTFRILAAAAAFGSALVLPLGALQAAPQVEIDYSDLDLTSASDVAALEARVETALRRLCPVEGAHLAARRAREACLDAARIEAEGKVRLAIARDNADRVRLAGQPGERPGA